MSSSRSKSSTSSNITDRRIGATDSAIVVTEGSSAYLSDYGAVAAGTGLAEMALITNTAVTQDVAGKAINGIVAAQDRALETVDRSIEEAYTFSSDVADSAFRFSGEALEESLSTLEMVNLRALDNVETANKGIFDTTERAIASVEASTRSDAAQSFNKLLSTTAVIGVVVAVSFAMRK